MAKAIRGPTVLWSSAACGIPFLAHATTYKLDSRRQKYGHRRTLDEHLDYHPITRRAWNKALEVNKEYQRGLKVQIVELEEKLAKRNLSLL